MPKFSVDFEKLGTNLLTKTYKCSAIDLERNFEKVAFDIVRFKDADQGADLWQIQSSDDGDYIVTKYEEKDVVKTASAQPWEVILSKASNTLNVFYKGEQLAKLSAEKVGVSAEELPFVGKYLPAKLAGNKKLVTALLSDLPESAKKVVLNKYPELF